MSSAFGFGRFTDYQVAAWIAELDALDALYFGLNNDSPFITDPATTELIGSSYNRQRGDFTLIGSNALVQPDDITFHGLPLSSYIAAITVWDAKIAGNARAAFVLKDPVELANGGDYTIPGSTVMLGLDVTVI